MVTHSEELVRVLTENTELAKNMFISLLLLLLLILSHTGDTILISVRKISGFATAADSFCFIGNWILFDIQFFSSSSARN